MCIFVEESTSNISWEFFDDSHIGASLDAEIGVMRRCR